MLKKNRILWSGNSHRQQQKCYTNPFFGCFEHPKGYGRHPNRFIGKVKFFGLNWTNKKCWNLHFCSGGALKAPPSTCRVKFDFFDVSKSKLESVIGTSTLSYGSKSTKSILIWWKYTNRETDSIYLHCCMLSNKAHIFL